MRRVSSKSVSTCSESLGQRPRANTKWLSTGARVGQCFVCMCERERGYVETPYLGIARPPLLLELLVLLQGGPGLPLQATHLPLVLLDQDVLFRAVLLL